MRTKTLIGVLLAAALLAVFGIGASAAAAEQEMTLREFALPESDTQQGSILVSVPKYFTVRFHALNPGLGREAEVTGMALEDGQEYALAPAPVRPGYIFKGWTTRGHITTEGEDSLSGKKIPAGIPPGTVYVADIKVSVTVYNGYVSPHVESEAHYYAVWENDKQFVPLPGVQKISRIRGSTYDDLLEGLNTKTMSWSTSNESVLKVDPETGRITKNSFSFAKIGKVTIIATEHNADEPYTRYAIQAKVIWEEPEWLAWVLVILCFGWVWL